ncbi:MAG: hypothetical protein JNG86_01955 [Verrucomicrobiaceae bacterium]|nr:hypothetical protein [Verrucomicrobiaceae bacterium]
MKPKDIFDLAVRLVGLFFLYQLAISLLQLLEWLLYVPKTNSDPRVIFSRMSWIRLLGQFLLTAWFLCGAEPFSRLAYRTVYRQRDTK